MGNIKIVRGVFDTKLELEHERTAKGKLMYLPARSLVACYQRDARTGRKNAIKHDFRSQNPTTRWSDVIRLNTNAIKNDNETDYSSQRQ